VKDNSLTNPAPEEDHLADNDPLSQHAHNDLATDDGAEHLQLLIKRPLPNRRIDKYLQSRFQQFSRTIIQRLIQEHAVKVNGRPTKSSYQLQNGDRLDLILPPPPTNELPGEPIPLDIVYEDEHLLAVNKQANLIIHPARGNRGGTLVNGLVHYSQSLSNVGPAFRPGIVHRLDRNTTGILIVAKTDTAHWRIAKQFEDRLTSKIYLAFVHGNLELDADVIKVPLGRHPRVREKYAARPESGKSAYTKYHVLKRFKGYTLVKLMPKTGRTHQLRVHMSISKHPIVADTMYGGKTMTLRQLADGAPLPKNDEPGHHLDPDQAVIDRQALHAAELHLHHPISRQPLDLLAPLPDDMNTFLALLQRYRALT